MGSSQSQTQPGEKSSWFSSSPTQIPPQQSSGFNTGLSIGGRKKKSKGKKKMNHKTKRRR